MAPKRETALDAWGKELAHACVAAGKTAKQLAGELHVAASTVSQWMNGRRTPHPDDVKRCDEALGTNGYLARYYKKWVNREIPSEWAERWMSAEALANLLQCFELSVLPGLLQTESYAPALMRVARHSPISVEERVRRRIERQKILNDANPTMCIFVIDENALRRNVGGPEVMLEQLMHLHDSANQPNIVVKVVPTGTEYYSSLPFMIAELDGMKVVSIDDTLMGRVIEENGKIADVTKIWEDIREAALSPAGSLALIERVITEWQNLTGVSRPAVAGTADSV